VPAPDWPRVSELFEAALDCPPPARNAWLDAACAGDAELRAAVGRLVDADECADGFLETPALGGATEPRAFGAYRALRLIGQGGMGEVWLAERRDDDDVMQQVAVKRLLYPTPELLRRFRRERRVLAGLTHPNIARLIDGGVADDALPYYVMEYVEGEPITAHADARGLGVGARIALFLAVCDAVEYAHRNLVVHRDLKPSNVLVTRGGDVKLLDFGIAKIIAASEDSEATATVVRRLTPDYAAPEQILGGAITTAADVYALGVLLCEIVAGDRPYRLDPRSGDLHGALAATTPAAPSQIAARLGRRAVARRLRGDIDRIVARALAPEPERRYPTAQALGDDLRRHLDGHPIVARRDDVAYRSLRFLRRHRAFSAAIAIAVLTLVAATAISVREATRADRERAAAVRTRDFVIEMLSNVGPYRRSVGRSPTLARLAETSAPRVLEEFAPEPEIQVPLLRAFAGVFLSLSRARDSGHYMELALERQWSAGAPLAERVASQLAIANDDYYQRRFDDADRLARDSLAGLAAAPPSGESRQLAFSAREVLLLSAWARGDFERAATMAGPLLTDLRAALGADDVEVASAENYVAYLALDRARLADAATLIEHYGRVDDAKFPAGYPGNYTDAMTIAWWLNEAGYYADAERVSTTVLDLRNRIYFGQGFGPASSHFMRGWARCALGRFEDGRADFEAALAVFGDSGNIGHMYLSRLRWREGACRLGANDLAGAAAAFTAAHSLAVADRGDDAPIARASSAALARIAWLRGDRTSATKALAVLAPSIGTDAYARDTRPWFAAAGITLADAPREDANDIDRAALVALANRLAVPEAN
jgi:serine/threonine-protein kinase